MSLNESIRCFKYSLKEFYSLIHNLLLLDKELGVIDENAIKGFVDDSGVTKKEKKQVMKFLREKGKGSFIETENVEFVCRKIWNIQKVSTQIPQ